MENNNNDLIIFGLFDEDVLLNDNIYKELSFGNKKNKLNYSDVRVEVYFYPIDFNYNLINDDTILKIKKINNGELFINEYEMGFDLSEINFDKFDQLMLGFVVNKNYYNINFYFHIKYKNNIVFKKKYDNLEKDKINFYCLLLKNENFVENSERSEESSQSEQSSQSEEIIHINNENNIINICNNNEYEFVNNYKWKIYDVDEEKIMN